MSRLCAIALFSLWQGGVVALNIPPNRVDRKSTQSLWLPGANPNKGFPSQSAWAWDKAEPKISLKTAGIGGKDESGTAAAWILNIVEAAHLLTFLPSFLASLAVMSSHDFWLQLFDGSELRVLLWCLAPLVAAVGGIPPIVMHTYESWQVAPFRNPVEGELSLQDYNNGWIRSVAYKLLFIIQGTGFLMANHGYNGFGTVAVSLGLLVLAYAGDQSKKTTFEVFGNPVFPIPIVTIPLVVWGLVFYLLASFDLSQHVGGNYAVSLALVSAPLLTAAGGVFEGVLAESLFNQLIHLGGVVLLILGASLQAWALFQVPSLFL